MAKLVKFSESASLGIHAMIVLASRHGQLVPLKEIASALSASEAHLSKVLQRLHKSELLKATRGPLGGYALTREPKEISLLEVYQAIEGPLHPRSCLFSMPVCTGMACELGAFVGDLEERLRDKLANTTLADLVQG